MDTVLDRPWTTEIFLAWEDRQEGENASYAAVPPLRSHVLLEQTAVAATLFQRDPNGAWIASAHTAGTLALPGLDLTLPLAELYAGLAFPA